MKRGFIWASAITDLKILASNSPMTEDLRALIKDADYYETVRGAVHPELRKAFRMSVVAATDPWAEIEYQSLYITDEDPENRVVLQEPTVKDPMVGVMVLKAARLRGESGMVYCGTPEQLARFAEKLSTYEERADDLDEKEFLECLVEAAEADGLKVIYHRVSPEHGGDADGDND